ncbi:HAD family hydrolase [Maricaulis sp.]|uniref:D-glycero-alpha-D-manno-heptose-1,7-bisphosphate 7-phosphatase n=1 Tax=Maricaulis sp. TaxID=1486257 RepID=UPI00262B64FB|nr:HAD family hydrolase [Maricaulis sp.]
MAEPFLVLLDRDGTINVDKHYLADPDGLELLPRAVAGLKAMQDAGAVLTIVTNQSGVGRGYFDLATAHAINDRLVELLKPHDITIRHIAMCPHAPDEDCDCRKPKTGMADQIARETGLDLTQAWVIGDKASDVQLGLNIGGRSLLIGPANAPDHGQAVTVPDLQAAATHILSRKAS